MTSKRNPVATAFARLSPDARAPTLPARTAVTWPSFFSRKATRCAPSSVARRYSTQTSPVNPVWFILHVDDMAATSLFVFDLDKATYDANTRPMLSHINVGTGEDITILELAQLVARVTGYAGRIVTDPSKPDGTMRKLMDVGRLADMGWRASIPLADGIAKTYQWFLDTPDKVRA